MRLCLTDLTRSGTTGSEVLPIPEVLSNGIAPQLRELQFLPQLKIILPCFEKDLK